MKNTKKAVNEEKTQNKGGVISVTYFLLGIFVGILIGTVILASLLGAVASKIQIEEINIDINETEITQTMIDYMMYKGIITKEHYANTSFDEDFGFITNKGE